MDCSIIINGVLKVEWKTDMEVEIPLYNNKKG